MNMPPPRLLVPITALLALTALVMALILYRGAPEAVFTMREGRVYAQQGSLHLRNRLDIRLPDAVLEALNSGVPLVFNVDLHLMEQRDWMWDRTLADYSRAYRLHFHTLSRSYLLTQLDTGQRTIHHILGGALARMSHHQALVLAALADLSPERSYQVRLRIHLEESELPAPLQAPARFSAAWNLDSGWYRWTWSP